MRDIGYSLDSAVADIVDNSIAARSDKIELFADPTSDAPYLAILDNGLGMDEPELFEAMRPGSKSPREKRAADDLGRFGLGLKTASFSQCRRMTVVTRKDGATHAACWDLDEVVRHDDWIIEIPKNVDIIPCAETLGKSGTLVLWEKIDRLLEADTKPHRQDLVRLIDEATSRLELVFHRFISGERGSRKIDISINGRALKPFDPFVTRHPATQSHPLETISVSGKLVEVQAYTLPHHSKVKPKEWEVNGGAEGYLKNQGFYIYRARSLIIHGTWFGLARQRELTKLCRVRIDMPNSLDSDWKIDVRKSSANPPSVVRDRLRRIIEEIGVSSKRVYNHRGRILHDENNLPVWVRSQKENEISYRINSDHPVIAALEAELSPETSSNFRKVFELIETSIPIDTIFSDVGENPDNITKPGMTDDAIDHAFQTTVSALLGKFSVEDLEEMLRSTEPFRSNWTRFSAEMERMKKEDSK